MIGITQIWERLGKANPYGIGPVVSLSATGPCNKRREINYIHLHVEDAQAIPVRDPAPCARSTRATSTEAGGGGILPSPYTTPSKCPGSSILREKFGYTPAPLLGSRARYTADHSCALFLAHSRPALRQKYQKIFKLPVHDRTMKPGVKLQVILCPFW